MNSLASKFTLPTRPTSTEAKRKKGVFSLLRYLAIVAGVIVGLGFVVVLAQFIYGFPVPIYSSDFGAYHVYNEATLAEVMHTIPMPEKALATSYYGACGTITEKDTISSTGKFYNCTSVYDVLYQGSGDECVDYAATSDAMLKAGYHLDPNSLSCTEGINGGLIAGYDSRQLTSLGHGDGRMFCYYPVNNDYISQLKPFPLSNKNFNCLVAVNTAG